MFPIKTPLQVFQFLMVCSELLANQIPPPENDPALQNYLYNAMQNYSSWLADRDPSVVSDMILLKGINISGLVDVELEISNQRMVGYSTATPGSITTISKLNLTTFLVSRFLTGGLIEFSGQYTVKRGVYKLSPSQELNFIGAGNWRIATNSSSESLTCTNFTVNDDGYLNLDIPSATLAWGYSSTWNEINFDGLKWSSDNAPLNEQGNDTIVQEALAKVYENFLTLLDRKNMTEPQIQLVMPRKLMITYLQECFSKDKLSDIVEFWQPTSSTTPEPGDTGGGETGNGVLVKSSFLSVFLSILLALCPKLISTCVTELFSK